MIYLKVPDQIKEIKKANEVGAVFLRRCYEHIKPGITTFELALLAEKFCGEYGVVPSFYNYRGYPGPLCVSLNDEIIHGVPGNTIIRNRDIVSVDFGVIRNGYYSDSAFTKILGRVSARTKKLVKTCEECLYKGIEQAKPGNCVRDISEAVYKHAVFHGFDVLRDYVGHGVGLAVHERPRVPNYPAPFGMDWKIKAGMVLAIEPMLVAGSYETRVAPNGWTVKTIDGKMSAHFERSVAVLSDGPEILGEIFKEGGI